MSRLNRGTSALLAFLWSAVEMLDLFTFCSRSVTTLSMSVLSTLVSSRAFTSGSVGLLCNSEAISCMLAYIKMSDSSLVCVLELT